MAAAQAQPAAPPPVDVAVDIRSSLLTGRFLLNARPYDAGDASSFTLSLVDTDLAGDSLFLGNFFDAVYSAPVVSGTYRPQYAYQFGDAVPRNVGQTLTPPVDASGHAVHDVDVPAVQVTADFLHNGKAFPQSPSETAHFYLVSGVTGQSIFLGASNAPGAAVTVLPGTYSVVYRHQSGSALPVNQNAVVAKRVRLTSSRHLTVRVRSSLVDSRVTLNGEPFPNSAYDFGSIALVNAKEGDVATLGDTFDLAPRRVIRGTYAAHYRHRQSTGIAPLNPDAIIARDVDIAQRDTRLALDVHAIVVAGQFQVNGSAAPVSAYDYARIGLRFIGTTATLPLGDTFEGFGPLPLVAGEYEAVYTHREGKALPANVDTVFIDRLSLLSTGTVDLDIPAIRVTLDLSLNGGPFPSSAYDFADLYARPAGDAAPAAGPLWLGTTLDGPLAVVLLPGRYDFVYACRQCDSLLPKNRHARFLEATELSASTSLVHDFKSRAVRLSATLNGAAFPADPAASAELFLGQNEDDKVSFGLTSDPAAGGPTQLLLGPYQAYYALRAPGDFSVMPLNRNAVVGSFVID